MVTIRDAHPDDLPAMVEIYNASILTTTTWSERQQTLDDRATWFDVRRARGDGVLVAADEVVVGFAAYSEFRNDDLWPGYRFTVENTVHVRDGWQGRGVGRRLMESLIEHAVRAGKHVMLAAVDGENLGSIRFHQSLGFVEVGRLAQTGWKFDRWLDLVLLQRTL